MYIQQLFFKRGNWVLIFLRSEKNLFRSQASQLIMFPSLHWPTQKPLNKKACFLPVLLNTKCPVFYHMPFRKRFWGLIRNWNLKCPCKSGFFYCQISIRQERYLKKQNKKKQNTVYSCDQSLGSPSPWKMWRQSCKITYLDITFQLFCRTW